MKAVVTVNHVQYIMDITRAVEIMRLVDGCERYSETWRSKTDGGAQYYVNDAPRTETDALKLVPDTLYLMAKKLGTPPERN